MFFQSTKTNTLTGENIKFGLEVQQRNTKELICFRRTELVARDTLLRKIELTHALEHIQKEAECPEAECLEDEKKVL